MSDTKYTPVTPMPHVSVGGAVLGPRIAAYLVDFLIVGFLGTIVFIFMSLLGIFTFGAAWLLLGAVYPVTAVVYNALTVSGYGRGTWGMRLFGIELVSLDGQRTDFITAAVHALFFYVSVSILTPLVLLVGIFRDDRRLLHDLLTGLIARRRS